jgi:hypothetical protein
MFTRIKDVMQGKAPLLASRSPKWDGVRDAHLKMQPTCMVCEGSENLNVHHIKPFHLHPELELDQSNLITLCECEKHGVNCHLLIGHLGNFRNVNTHVLEDVTIWNARLKEKNDNPDV